MREVGVLSNHRSVVRMTEATNISWMIFPARRLPVTKYMTQNAAMPMPTKTEIVYTVRYLDERVSIRVHQRNCPTY